MKKRRWTNTIAWGTGFCLLLLLLLYRPGDGGLFAVDTMKMIFLKSSVCLLFPDGGAMVIDIGEGTTDESMRTIKESILETEKIYRLFTSFGWRPRIDWLLVAPRKREWDVRLVDMLNAFDVHEIHLPLDTRAQKRQQIGTSLTRMLLQVSLASSAVRNLGEKRTIDIAQSVSGVTFHTLLPHGTATGRDEEPPAFCGLVVYNKIRVLIMGDLTEQQQQFLVDHFPSEIKADVFYHPPALNPGFAEMVGASRDIPYDGAPIIITTNGEALEEKTNE